MKNTLRQTSEGSKKTDDRLPGCHNHRAHHHPHRAEHAHHPPNILIIIIITLIINFVVILISNLVSFPSYPRPCQLHVLVYDFGIMFINMFA